MCNFLEKRMNETKKSKKERVQALKRNRKYRIKHRKWALRVIKSGKKLVAGAATLCLDCNKSVFENRLGCSCNVDFNIQYRGVIHGYHIITLVGNGHKTPLAKKVIFISYADLKKDIENKVEFIDLSSKEEFIIES